MSRVFHHDNILVLSMNEQAQTRLSYELSSNDCEVRQFYNLSELVDYIGKDPTLCLVIYLDSLSPSLFDLDLYKELADQFFLIIVDDLGEGLPREELSEIPFTSIINRDDEAALYDIDSFLTEFYGDEAA